MQFLGGDCFMVKRLKWLAFNIQQFSTKLLNNINHKGTRARFFLNNVMGKFARAWMLSEGSFSVEILRPEKMEPDMASGLKKPVEFDYWFFKRCYLLDLS